LNEKMKTLIKVVLWSNRYRNGSSCGNFDIEKWRGWCGRKKGAKDDLDWVALW